MISLNIQTDDSPLSRLMASCLIIARHLNVNIHFLFKGRRIIINPEESYEVQQDNIHDQFWPEMSMTKFLNMRNEVDNEEIYKEYFS